MTYHPILSDSISNIHLDFAHHRLDGSDVCLPTYSTRLRVQPAAGLLCVSIFKSSQRSSIQVCYVFTTFELVSLLTIDSLISVLQDSIAYKYKGKYFKLGLSDLPRGTDDLPVCFKTPWPSSI